jgi:hypothetical protein
MGMLDDVIRGVTALGIGSGFGAIVTSLITSHSSKGKSRAEAADILIGAAERVGKMNASLGDENTRLHTSLDLAIEAVLKFADGRISKEQMLEIVGRLR